MRKPSQIVYKTQATATGGRDGKASTNDGRLSVSLSVPKEMGGDGGNGTNPEQLFAAGYSACFIGAIKHVGAVEKISIPSDVSITGEVGIGPTEGGFALEVTLSVSLPGMDRAVAEDVVAKAHQVCPYSNATRNNIDVNLVLA